MHALSCLLQNSQFQHVNHSEIADQMAAYEIIISMTPYCPTPQHLLHIEEVKEGVNLLSLKTLVNQHVLDT